MACSCSSTPFTSVPGSSPASCSSSSSSVPNSSSSLSFSHHHHQQLPHLSSGSNSIRNAPPWNCEKRKKQGAAFPCFVTAAKQEQPAKAKRPRQRGGGGGDAGAAVAVKEKERAKRGSSGGRTPSSPTTTSSRGGSRRQNYEDEEDEDKDEDEEDEEFPFNDGDGDDELPVLPNPPAGFVLADDGSVSLMAPPNKRVASIFDPATGLSLECLVRRVFSSSDGRQCFLLCPLDTPVQILKIEGEDEVLKEITDEELDDIFPTASYELAKRRLHLVLSGYCLTLRGGFCYSEDDVMDLNTVYGESGGESLHEGVEVASFTMKGSEYLVYTPFDPLMFVAYKDDETGELIIADDELLDDEAVLDAVDEEKEFQAYMDEEIAMNASEDEESESD